jgi:hypothetical protein
MVEPSLSAPSPRFRPRLRRQLGPPARLVNVNLGSEATGTRQTNRVARTEHRPHAEVRAQGHPIAQSAMGTPKRASKAAGRGVELRIIRLNRSASSPGWDKQQKKNIPQNQSSRRFGENYIDTIGDKE